MFKSNSFFEKLKLVRKKASKALDIIIYVCIIATVINFGVKYVSAQNNAAPATNDDPTISTNTDPSAAAVTTPENSTQTENKIEAEYVAPGASQVTVENLNQAQGGLLNPQPAEAVNIWDIGVGAYGIYCGVEKLRGNECPTIRPVWMMSAVFEDGLANTVVTISCQKYYAEALKDHKEKGEGCGSVAEYRQQNSVSYKPGYNLYPLGGAGILASTIDYSSTEALPPTDLALYMNDLTKDNILGVQPAYAQSAFQGDFRNFVLTAWKFTRNIALALMGVVIGISALMIMFRAQIAPRVSVSIYNVLPMIPIGLGLILLSYPIITLIFSLMWPLRDFAVALGQEILAEAFTGFASRVSTGELVLTTFNGFFGFITDLGIAALIGLLTLVTFLLLALFIFISLIFTYINVYISFMFKTIASPLVILISMLPGRSGVLINFAKGLVADLLAIPVLWFFVFIGLAIMSYSSGGAYTVGLDGSGWLFGSKWAILFTYIAKYFIGIGVIWKARSARHILKGMLGVNDDMWGITPEKKR
jgi:hypothetical protein